MNFTNRQTLVGILASIVLILLLGFGQRSNAFPDKPTSFADIGVTSTLNIGGSVTPNPGTNYRVEAEGNGAYFNGVSSVSSILQGGTNPPSRDWILDTNGSTMRTVLVDLRTPVPNSGAQPVFAWQTVPTRIIVKCHEALSGSFVAIPLNTTVSCPMSVRFTYARTDYRLMMSSGPGSQLDYAETNNAQVSCTAAKSVNGSSQCIAWTILPITQADGPVQNVARLERFGSGGKLTNLGDFYVTFNFNVSNP
jgi:hypothetical protein